MKVAIKFCGGCDPSYDRMELFERIDAAARGTIQWVTIGENGNQTVLLISGCARSCPRDELPPIARLLSLTSDSTSPERVIESLMEKGDRKCR